jgi:hypothetical protein
VLIRPEDELATWGKAQSLYLKDKKQRTEFSSEVVFKVASHIKGKQSGARLINYVTRNHHENKTLQLSDLYRDKSQVIVCDELNNRLSHDHIETVKAAWGREFIERGDTGRVLSHLIFSSDKIKDPLEMSRIVNESLAKTLGKDGFRYITAVHNDTDKLHCHVVVNTYNEILQRKLHMSKEWTHLQRMNFADTAQKYGYKHVATMKKWRVGKTIGDESGEVKSANVAEFGEAPYQFDRTQKSSYYIKLDDGSVIWGKGLKAAIEKSGAKVGDGISIKNKGASLVSIKDKNGKDTTIKRNEWEVQKLAKPLKRKLVKAKKPEYSSKDFEVVKNSRKIVSEYALQQKAKDFVRLEAEIKQPNTEQIALLEAYKKEIPQKILTQARAAYKIESDPLYQSKLKQVRFLESQHKKGLWKETLTHKTLELERSTTNKELKARLDLLFPKDVNKKALRQSFAVQQKTQAQIQAIPLLRKLTPEKVPLLIKQLEKEIPNVAISDKYKVQLQKGLAKQTQGEFNSMLERRITSIRQHLTHDKPLSANQELSKVYAALKGQPRQVEMSKTLTELRSQISVKRKALTSELSQLRVTNKDLAKGFISTMTAKERLALNRQIDPVAKRINQIETGLGFKQSQTQTIKHSR